MGTNVGTEKFGLGARGTTHPKTTRQIYNAATQFMYEKRGMPSVSLLSTGSGAKGTILNVTTNTSVGAGAGSISPRGFPYVSLALNPAVDNDFAFHYVADARL